MKRSICLFVLAMASLAVFVQTSMAQKSGTDDFEKMTFEVELDKTHYVLFEPIFVRFKFSNLTGVTQTTYLPSFLSESKLKVHFNGKTSVFEHLSTITGPGIRFPSAVSPDWVSTTDEVLAPARVDTIFPAPGTYQLEFVLHNSRGNKMLNSNVIEVRLERPLGIDKEAYDFIAKHREFFGLSSWTPDDDKSQALLEEFVRKYGQSAYGEIAMSNLGTFYLTRGEFDKAKVEFEKIKSSENEIVAKEAKHSLADISKRKTAEKPKKNGK